MKPRIAVLALLVGLLLLVGMIPAATAQTEERIPPNVPSVQERPYPDPEPVYHPPMHQPQRSALRAVGTPQPGPIGDSRYKARRVEREQGRAGAVALASTLSVGEPNLPITDGPERIPDSVLPEGGDLAYRPSVSADGRYTAFYSLAGNLVTGDRDGASDVFRFDRSTGQVVMVSTPQDGSEISGYFYEPSISDDGRFIVFYGWTYDLVDHEDEWIADIYVWDASDGSIVRISDASDGSAADSDSFAPEISPDGESVVFSSWATNLVPGDSNEASDIFLYNFASGTIERVSITSAEAQVNGSSYSPVVAEDGLFVAYHSYASNLVTGDTNGEPDIFVRDVAAGTTARVSVSNAGAQGNFGSYVPDISADGRNIAFESEDGTFVMDDTNGSNDIFVRNRQASTTTRVSLDENGNELFDWPYAPTLSSDGTRVAFTAYEPLMAIDTNNMSDVYVSDWQVGTLSLASVGVGGVLGDDYAESSALSADGTVVFFESFATNLVAGDSNDSQDIFGREMGASDTFRVSIPAYDYQEPAANAGWDTPALSADGRLIAFMSEASNLVAGDTNQDSDLFIYNRDTDETTLINKRYWGGPAFCCTGHPGVSDDGQIIVYQSTDSYIVENDDNSTYDIFVYDRAMDETTRVSVDSAGNESNSASYNPVVSGDGNVVAFYSYADNLVGDDYNGMADIFVHDRTTGETTRVSVDSTGSESDGESYDPSLSHDGRYVVFDSDSDSLVDIDTNGHTDVFVHDRQTGETTLVSVNVWGDNSGVTGSWAASISGNAQWVVFSSSAYDLIPFTPVEFTDNWANDIFLHDLWSGRTVMVSHTSDGGMVNDDSWYPDISADGRTITFESWATNLVGDDVNGERDTFLYDRYSGSTVRLSESATGEEGDNESTDVALSADGATAAFLSFASNLVPDDAYGFRDVFVVEQEVIEPVLYSVSGTILDDLGSPLEGVIVAPVNASANFAVSDADGDYTLELPAGDYSLEAAKIEYRFLPTIQPVSVGPNLTGIDFTAVYDNYRILYSWVAEDAYVDQAKKTTNFGSAPIMRVKNASADMNAYLKFDIVGLDPLPGTCRQYGYTWLRAYVKEPSTDGGSIFSVGNSWSENTITWNNAPAITGAAIGEYGSVSDESFAYAELFSPIESDGIYSFAIHNNATNSVDYSSWEGGAYALIGVNYLQDTIRVPVANVDLSIRSGISPFTLSFNSDWSNGCPTSWHWDFDDGTTSTEQNPTHTFVDVGDYDVTLTVSNSLGSSSRTETIHVLDLPTSYYISPSTNATIGGIPAQAADILRYDKTANDWDMVYDGSDHGTTKNIGSFTFDGEDLLLVFSVNQTIPGLGIATPYDVVRFTADNPGVYPLGSGTYSWEWRGKPNGLTTTAEKIDAFTNGWGDYLFSTAGAAALPTSPVIKAADEDLFVWPTWSGAWNHIGLDGSTVPGLAAEDINGVGYDDDTGDIYVTILGAFNLGGVAGDGKSIVRLNPNGGSVWDGNTQWAPTLVPWLAPGATFPSTIDAIELAR